jgi:rhamnose transport system substrate-binding protein
LITDRVRPIAALSLAAAFAVAACGGGAATTAPSAAASASASAAAPESASASADAAGSPSAAAADLNVVFIPKAINNPYFDAAAEGAQKAATELGGQFKQIGSQNATAAEQIPFIQDATTQGYKAIVVSATGADEVAPALTAAKDAGIKVVGYDSSPAEGAYDVFVNQTDFSLIGSSMAQWTCDIVPDCSGEIAILSATATATNQNAWIEDFNKVLTTDPKYANLKLVDTVYGDDDNTKSTNEANGLLQKYPDLKAIVAPTTVGILAAAQVVKQAGSSVKVTGLGLPNDMKAFVADGTSPKFGLWSVPDLGYLAYHVAAKLISGEITGAPGETFSVPGLNGDQPYTIGEKSVVILGPPFEFNADNIDQFNF